jgi:hypothetical protein
VRQDEPCTTCQTLWRARMLKLRRAGCVFVQGFVSNPFSISGDCTVDYNCYSTPCLSAYSRFSTSSMALSWQMLQIIQIFVPPARVFILP